MNDFINVKNFKKTFLIMFFSMLAVFIVCLCSFFPGVGMNDGLNILRSETELTSQFSVFYVYFILFLHNISDALTGGDQLTIALYSVIQLTLTAFILTIITVWTCKKNVPVFVKWCTYCFYLFHPIIAIYSIAMIRDTLFACSMVMIVILTYDIITRSRSVKKKSFWILYAFSIAGTAVLRSNGIFIIVPFLIVLLIAVKKTRKNTAIIFGIVIGVTVISSFLKSNERGDMFQEKVGIPLQQIAVVVKNDGVISDDDREFINKIMPEDKIKEKYNPRTSDPIKWSNDFNRTYLDDHKRRFVKTWFNIFRDNPGICLNAWVQCTYYFMLPVQEGTVQTFFTIEDVADNTWLVDFLKERGIHDRPLIGEKINNVIRKYYYLSKYFLREGVLFWMTIASLIVYRVRSKNRKAVIIYLPFILLWLTMILSTPIAFSMRYVFAYVIALFPVTLGLALIKNKH